MTADEEAKKRQTNKKNKKKKKPRKDKWGQPLPSVEEEEEQQQQPFNDSSYNALPDEEEQEEEAQDQEQEQEEEGFVAYENTKIVVSGMPYSTSEDQIRRLFKDIGTISQLQLSRFPDSGNFRGLAFVTFPVSTLSSHLS